MGNTILVDTSKCTGCKGCQNACKNWNQLPAEMTSFTGSYENPPTFLPNTWCRVSFNEAVEGNVVRWYFAKLQCMHCQDPVCLNECPYNAIYRTDLGTIARDWHRCKGCRTCEYVCPYQVPKVGSNYRKMFKCTLCYDRIKDGLKPACVATCPSGALNFGDESEMLALAQSRAAEVGGQVYGQGNRVIYVLLTDQATYRIQPGALGFPPGHRCMGW